ncbi:hypothetical protein GRX03_12005 [Halovenus sp. WSH3]|uniref:Uncharacterized protein n=1 Tax=Halovenus carboxidivorans TaxID=2692199 RepID=A0A6B0T9S8_9EURY|nr:hypothetical protein [Halovenus carboxidivorans]MXR52323.1 hypothetical protein [Halovenus carboxidivorans]
MSETEYNAEGGVTIRLDADDLNHLLTHGRSTVCKDAGPLEIKIQAEGKVRHQVVLDDREGNTETIVSPDGGEQA